MSIRSVFIALLLVVPIASAVELVVKPHRILGNQRTFVRDVEDKRYSVWTISQDKVNAILSEFGLDPEGVNLKEGEVLVVFLNDRIEEDLVQIVFNKTANRHFGDYADSGIRMKLQALEKGKKYTHLTAVIFSQGGKPRHIGMRGMVAGGNSENR